MMTNWKKLLALLLCLALCLSVFPMTASAQEEMGGGSDENLKEGENSVYNHQISTGEAYNITGLSSTFDVTYTIDAADPQYLFDCVLRVYVSTDPNFYLSEEELGSAKCVEYWIVDPDAPLPENQTTQITLNDLRPNTTYYYRAYLVHYDTGSVIAEESDGGVKSFTTAETVDELFTVEVYASPGSAAVVSISPAQSEYSYNTTVTVTADVPEGYGFRGWYPVIDVFEDGIDYDYDNRLADTLSYSFPVLKNTRVVAVFQKYMDWGLYEDDTLLQFWGSGPMTDYESETALPWYDQRDTISKVEILDGITKIGNHAFHALSRLTEITIPASVTEIGAHAFDGCEQLTLVNYRGTRAQWQEISIGTQQDLFPGENTTFHCLEDEFFTLAVYSIDRNCTVSSLANVSIDPARSEYPYGLDVTVTTDVPEGYRFVGWYPFWGMEEGAIIGYSEDDCRSQELSYTFPVQGDTCLAAVFETAGGGGDDGTSALDGYHHSIHITGVSDIESTSARINGTIHYDDSDETHMIYNANPPPRRGYWLVNLFMSTDPDFFRSTDGLDQADFQSFIISDNTTDQEFTMKVQELVPGVQYYCCAHLTHIASTTTLAMEELAEGFTATSFQTVSAGIPEAVIEEGPYSGQIFQFTPPADNAYSITTESIGSVRVKTADGAVIAEDYRFDQNAEELNTVFLAKAGDLLYIYAPDEFTLHYAKDTVQNVSLGVPLTVTASKGVCFVPETDGTYALIASGTMGTLAIADLQNATWEPCPGNLKRATLQAGESVLMKWDGNPTKNVTYTVSDAATDVMTRIHAVDTGDNIRSQMQQIYRFDPDGLEAVMKTNDADVVDTIRNLEELASGGPATVVIQGTAVDDFKDVKVLGASLNNNITENGEEIIEAANLVVDSASTALQIPDYEQFSKLSFSLSLTNISNTGELAFPIVVDFCLKDTDIDRNELKLFHFHEDGSCEEVPVSVYLDNSDPDASDWYAKIYLTGLSDFALVYPEGGSGTWSGLNWTLESDGTLKISGDAEMADATDTSKPGWLEENTISRIRKVSLANGVRSIGNGTFKDCVNLTEVSICDCVTGIGEAAFSGCTNLTGITIPRNVESIGDSAFQNCSSLSVVHLKGSMPAFGDQVFYGVDEANICYPEPSVTYFESKKLDYGAGHLNWVPEAAGQYDIYWADGSLIEAQTIVGGPSPCVPVRIHVSGSVTLNGKVMFSSGYAELVGETDEAGKAPELVNTLWEIAALDVVGGYVTVSDLKMTCSEGAGGWTGGFILCSEEAELNCYRLVIDGTGTDIGSAITGWDRIEVYDCVIEHCLTGVYGIMTLHNTTIHDCETAIMSNITLDHCTITNNDCFSSNDFDGQVRMRGGSVTGNGQTNLKKIDLYIDGAPVIDNLDLCRKNIYIVGELTEGTSITVCNAGPERIIAKRIENGFVPQSSTLAQYFTYVPSASELASNAEFTGIEFDGECFRVILQLKSKDIYWRDNEIVAESKVYGGTETEPVTIHVQGKVTLAGAIEFTAGYTVLVGEAVEDATEPELVNSLRETIILNVADGHVTVSDLKMTCTEGSGGLNSGFVFCEEAAELNCYRLVIDGSGGDFGSAIAGRDRIEVYDSVIEHCDTGVYGTMTLHNTAIHDCVTGIMSNIELDHCTITNNDCFASNDFDGQVRMHGGSVTGHRDTNLKKIDLYIDGAPVIDKLDLCGKYLRIAGELEEGTDITVCNSGAERIVAKLTEDASLVWLSEDQAEYFHYEPNESEQSSNIEFVGIILDLDCFKVETRQKSRDIYWSDGAIIPATKVSGGTESEPVTIHVQGKVTLTGAIEFTTGYTVLVGEAVEDAAEPELVNTLWEIAALDVVGGHLTVSDLKMTCSEGAGGWTGGFILCSEEAELNCYRLVIDGTGTDIGSAIAGRDRIEVYDSVIEHCSTGVYGTMTLHNTTIHDCVTGIMSNIELDHCTVINNDCFASNDFDGQVRMHGGSVTGHRDTNLKKIDLYIDGAPVIDRLDLCGKYLRIAGELEEGTDITVCNAGSERIVAKSADDASAPGISGNYAMYFHYQPSTSETNGNGVYSQPYMDFVRESIRIRVDYKLYVPAASDQQVQTGYVIEPEIHELDGSYSAVDEDHSRMMEEVDGEEIRHYYLVYEDGSVWYSLRIEEGYQQSEDFQVYLNDEALDLTSTPPAEGTQQRGLKKLAGLLKRSNEGEENVFYFRVSADDIKAAGSTGIRVAGLVKMEYRITYDPNGGAGEPESQIKPHCVEIRLSETIPVREGYTFVGWATDAEALIVTYRPGDLYGNNEDLALRAVWATPDFVLPLALTAIEEEAFCGAGFEFVQLPENAVSIGPRAFADCPNLAEVLIPDSVTEIDGSAFSGAEGLTVLGVPGSAAERFARENGFAFIPLE